MLTGKPLRRLVEQLRVQEQLPAPRKIPRKLKKAWKRAVMERVREHFKIFKGDRPRVRLHWVPGSGWTLTVVRRYWMITKAGMR